MAHLLTVFIVGLQEKHRKLGVAAAGHDISPAQSTLYFVAKLFHALF